MTEFRAPAVELARFRLRVVVAAVFVLVCFGLLAARFHHLQVKRHDYFLTRAEDNRIALLPVVPHRGTIVDRKGVVLARNVEPGNAVAAASQCARGSVTAVTATGFTVLTPPTPLRPAPGDWRRLRGRTACSPGLRVRAQAPARRSARCGHRPARARHRARCSRAGAGSA